MSKYFEQATLIEYLNENVATLEDGFTTMNCVTLAILHTPPADVVEVVRCKDCEYFTPDALLDRTDYPNEIEADGLCDNTDKYTDETDFCSCGKRNDNEPQKTNHDSLCETETYKVGDVK